MQAELTTVLSVVDVGCGTGLMSVGLHERGAFVMGIDSSPTMLKRAVAKRRIDQAINGSADDIPLPSHSVDAAIVGALLHIHVDPDAVIREALRIVKPGGPIVVTSPIPALSPQRMRDIDRLHGRGLGSATLAHVLRLAVGIVGSFSDGPVASRARSLSEIDVTAVLQSAGSHPAKVGIRSLGVVGGAQSIWVLRRPTH